jgi:hypothetical protein
MIRVASKNAMPPMPAPEEFLLQGSQQGPEGLSEELVEQDAAVSEPAVDPMIEEAPQGGGVVDQAIVVYMEGEYGPFECQRCVHFVGPNSCAVVAGQIDPKGLCRIFEPSNSSPTDAPVEEEVPVAPEVEPIEPEGLTDEFPE